MFRLGLAVGGSPVIRQAVRCPLAHELMMRGVLEHGERVPSAEVSEWIDDFVGCSLISDMLGAPTTPERIATDRPAACPIRIGWAERDRIVPYRRYGRPLRKVFPAAEFVRMPGCGHVPTYDDPDLVCRTILEVTTASLASTA